MTYSTRYDHQQHENKIYKLWQESGAFNPDTVNLERANTDSSTTQPFCIIMPPPNANDPLHIGHALFVALEDIMIRFHRMRGDDTVWIPGTDHAGIETQYVFEKKLQKEGSSRFQFDKKTLYNKIWDYVQENSRVAVEQIKAIGASADWSRFKFTLDKDVVVFVTKTFEKMHQDGLVYRDLQLVNYCSKCGTGYSELEINRISKPTPLYYIKYPFKRDQNRYVVIATTRPEPIFADTHLAVHPKDSKNNHLVGQEAVNPLTKKPMKIIADEFVDPDFGTGVVKLTPAHDQADFEVAKKHNLPVIEAVDRRGRITAQGGKYQGLPTKEARRLVVEDLTNAGLVEKIDKNHQSAVGHCYRCNRVIEPLPMTQFFVKVKDPKHNLTQKALEALDSGKTIVHGAGQEKILRHWLTNLKDWNISRQIVWGIPIPAWYKVEGFEEEIFINFIDKKEKNQSGTLGKLLEEYSLEEVQDGLQRVEASKAVPYQVSQNKPSSGGWLPETDTFDTWFSSAQWPVVTLKTSGVSGDFERFYPTSVMETAYDILMFWVMRMMMMGNYLTNQAPFREIYLHGLVRDQKGQKMSKSKANTINPIETIKKYGADALRLGLVIRSTPAQDKNVGERDFKAMRNLTNKIWNAARFVILRLEENQDKNQDGSKKSSTNMNQDQGEEKSLTQEFDQHLAGVIKDITKQFLDRKIGLAAETSYNEFWHWYCDQCIEDNKDGKLSDAKLLEGLVVFLKLFHPFVPFVTEVVWQKLHKKKMVDHPLLISAHWPSW